MIVVLHKPVALGIYRLNEWYQVLIQDLTVKLSIHDAFKYTRTSSTVPADACPYMNFHGVLWSRLVAGFLSCFPATKSAVCFHLLQDGGASMSLSTTLKCHCLFGWTSWGTAYCQLVCVENREKRLRWAQKHLGANPHHVIWTDETSVQNSYQLFRSSFIVLCHGRHRFSPELVQ